MLYTVKAMVVDPTTGERIAGPRDEVIDTDTNELFVDAGGRWDVEDMYMAFWNRLNPSQEHEPPERVVVLSVTEVDA